MGFLQRGILIYLAIAIAVAMSMPSAIFNSGSPADNTVLSWFNLQYNPGTDTIQMKNTTNNGLNSGLPTSNFGTPSSPASSGSLIGFIDPVYQVFSWIGTVFKVVGSPLYLLSGGSAAVADTSVNSPMQMGLLLIFVIPLTLLMVIGLIIWIRSGFA